jgi:hypothetical protein
MQYEFHSVRKRQKAKGRAEYAQSPLYIHREEDLVAFDSRGVYYYMLSIVCHRSCVSSIFPGQQRGRRTFGPSIFFFFFFASPIIGVRRFPD